jgi:hypothetical protein
VAGRHPIPLQLESLPTQPHIVATCTNGLPYLWDIRSTARPVAACHGYTRWDNDPLHQDPYISHACTSMESLISKHAATHHPIGSSSSSQPQRQYSHLQLLRQEMIILNVKFDPVNSGYHMDVTHADDDDDSDAVDALHGHMDRIRYIKNILTKIFLLFCCFGPSRGMYGYVRFE